MRKCYTQKLIVSGNNVELYEYESPVVPLRCNRIGRAGQTNTTDEQKRQNREKTASRARQKVRRYANANFSNRSKFVTLTFADNVTDLKKANKLFTDFMRRLSYQLHTKLQYIAVPEFQERGAVHYHLLMNCSYVPKERLAEIWGHGFVKINRIDNVDNIGAYITKYMTKDNLDERLAGEKCFFMSRNLTAPQTTTDSETIEKVLAEMTVKRVACSSSFDSEYYGTVNYMQFILDAPLSLSDFRKPLESRCFPPLWCDEFTPVPLPQ